MTAQRVTDRTDVLQARDDVDADHIGAIYREWQRELDVEYARAIPGLKDATAPWRQRAAEAAGLLRRIRSAARNAAA